MAATQENTRGSKVLLGVIGGIGAAIGIWAMSALTFSLSQSGWSVAELTRQYMVAVGAIGEFETLVDFYTHIKGIEYIICVAFFAAFPVFFKYVNNTKTAVTVKQ
ncbi:MAG: hypothetical protein H8E41_10140 [Desulfobulbaceae bacterium]|uniref:Uncharacterized protein n=1 Tax=Candidatus Desulfobia pelagia TaxID=2841692 RepID=A0A8J6NDZ0_9BACT|nr:hypothetical protein [Candidatus Desulfobia pelagia]